MTTLTIRTSRKTEVVDVTSQVERVVRDSGVADGLCHVYVPHATAAIVINESADPHVGDDLLDALDRLLPQGVWRHDRIDDNGAAHLKAAILGPGETIPVQRGRLALGRWQAVMLVDLDGPRERAVHVSVR